MFAQWKQYQRLLVNHWQFDVQWLATPLTPYHGKEITFACQQICDSVFIMAHCLSKTYSVATIRAHIGASHAIDTTNPRTVRWLLKFWVSRLRVMRKHITWIIVSKNAQLAKTLALPEMHSFHVGNKFKCSRHQQQQNKPTWHAKTPL